jgi:glyoxylase-like metal-dependent hydrolase (beta-lactamase superfamily II)
MRVHHLNCGTMRPLGGRLLDGRPRLARRAELVCHCLLLETDAGLVLVETGLGTQAVRRPDEWLGRWFQATVAPERLADQTAVAQVERLGHRAEDVRHIVLTHLDLDHAGGLADFPWATVHVHETELDALRHPASWAERTRYRQAQFAHRPRFRPYRAEGEPWFGFAAARELDGLGADVLLVPLAGHSRGHAGVAVRTDERWLLHAGDSYFFHGETDPAAPNAPAGIRLFETMVQFERRTRLDNQRRLRALVAGHRAEVDVFCAHDAREFGRLRAGQPARG